MTKILVVDDNPAVCKALELLFQLHDLDVTLARSPDEALAIVRREDVSVVVSDMNFKRDTTSGAEGEELMRAIRGLDPEMPILLMTAFTSLETAVRLVKLGAADYIKKPWDDEKLVATVKNLVALRALGDENAFLRGERQRAREGLARSADLRGLVYASQAMHEVVSLAVKVAAADAPVLILGPNGAGKEKIAEIVQANSRRKDKPFVRVNAGGLPDSLLEAELFGAEAGAFTGANKARAGRFEEAHGGTLFLDEIGNLSLAGQMKLLRVLQTGELQRLGSSQTRRADVRVVSATNADLPKGIREGTFREDLYFRLNVIELRLPRLRERAEDIALLADHFLAAHRKKDPSSRVTSFTAEAKEALLAHEWPGNVRELENRIHRALLVASGERITASDLDLVRASSPSPASPEGSEASDPDRAEVERALAEAGGVVSKAAAALGVSRQALYRRMERAGLELERRVKR